MKTVMTLITLLVVVALAGCGSSNPPSQAAKPVSTTTPLSKAAYSAELQQVGTSLVTALNSLGQKSSNFRRIETHVGRGQAALERAASRLATTTPPADARADNTRLVSGMRTFAAQLARLRSAAAKRNLKAVIAADRGLDRSPAVKAMMAAVANLQRKGYTLGQLAPSGKD